MADTLNWNDDFTAKCGKAVARAWTDPAYKEKLLGEPRAALAEAGIDVPADMGVQVKEGTAETLHLMLPPPPEGEISDAEALEATAGVCSLCCCSCGG